MTTPSAPTAPAAGPARLRTATAERQRATAVIEESVARGALSEAEGAERIAAATSATYRDELAALVVDLPLSRTKPLWRGRADPGTTAASGALTDTYRAFVAFVARHRVWTVVVAIVLVAAVVTAGALGWDEFGGGGGRMHHEHFTGQSEH